MVTGAAGQVGRELVTAFDGWDVVPLDRARLDVGDRRAVARALASLRPAVVVNAAAWTDVDACELDPVRAMRENAEAVRWLAEACGEVGAHLCHISTDYVFDGRAGRPYTEEDEPNPISVYGRSKRAGELELATGSTLVRTSWVFGVHGRNVVKTVLGLAAEPGRVLRFVDDQVGCPTEASELAATIRELVELRAGGTFHVTNEGEMSWFELARCVMEAAGEDPGRVVAIETAQLDPPLPAPRPPYSALAGVATAAAGVRRPGPVVPAIQRVVQRLTVGRAGS